MTTLIDKIDDTFLELSGLKHADGRPATALLKAACDRMGGHLVQHFSEQAERIVGVLTPHRDDMAALAEQIRRDGLLDWSKDRASRFANLIQTIIDLIDKAPNPSKMSGPPSTKDLEFLDDSRNAPLLRLSFGEHTALVQAVAMFGYLFAMTTRPAQIKREIECAEATAWLSGNNERRRRAELN